jgi:hypothetical protein
MNFTSKKSLRILIVGLCLLPVVYFVSFTGVLSLPAYWLSPEWVKESKTEGQLTANLKAEFPLGMEKWRFVEKMKKAGFEPIWAAPLTVVLPLFIDFIFFHVLSNASRCGKKIKTER